MGPRAVHEQRGPGEQLESQPLARAPPQRVADGERDGEERRPFRGGAQDPDAGSPPSVGRPVEQAALAQHDLETGPPSPLQDVQEFAGDR